MYQYRNDYYYLCCPNMLPLKWDKTWAQMIRNNLKRSTWVDTRMSGKMCSFDLILSYILLRVFAFPINFFRFFSALLSLSLSHTIYLVFFFIPNDWLWKKWLCGLYYYIISPHDIYLFCHHLLWYMWDKKIVSTNTKMQYIRRNQ